MLRFRNLFSAWLRFHKKFQFLMRCKTETLSYYSRPSLWISRIPLASPASSRFALQRGTVTSGDTDLVVGEGFRAPRNCIAEIGTSGESKMRRIFCAFCVTLLATFTATGQVNIINTYAGGAAQPSAATNAYLPEPASAVRDSAGNTYIAVPALNVVYEVSAGGNLSVYAGNGVAGFSGDGGIAAQAQLDFPEGLAIDSANNLFIADSVNNRIRRVDALTHTITTVAGSEDPGFGAFAGDGGPAVSARLNSPGGVAVDGNGNLFIADSGNAVVRRVVATTQIITTYAGVNPVGNALFGCNSGPATQTAFKNVVGIAVDRFGNVFASDTSQNIVCKIDTSQNITLYAGTAGNPGTPGASNGDGGPATAAQFSLPKSLATDATGNLYITDSGNPKIRVVDTSANHIITTVAGIGTICINADEPACGDGGLATQAELDGPSGIFIDANNNIIITDSRNMRVRVVSAANSTIANLAGGGTGGDGGLATAAILGLAQTLAVDSSENVFALETAGKRLREIGTNGDINTVAGLGVGGANVNCPQPNCNGDGGPAATARFVDPEGVTKDAQGNFYIVDAGESVVRVINNQASPITVATVTIAPGDIATVAGNGIQCKPSSGNYPTCGDGGSATSASLGVPAGVAVDASGNIYISDQALNTVRVVNTSGFINTFAGKPGQACTVYRPGNCGDFGVPTSALLNAPIGLAVSPTISNGVPQSGSTDVFIADSGDNAIRKVNITVGTAVFETISSFAFNGVATFGGDGGRPLEASMYAPEFVAVDNFENLFISGGANNVVRRVDAFSDLINTIAGDVNNLNGGFSGDGGPSTQAMIENTGVAVFTTQQGTHDVFIADSGSNHVRKVNLAPLLSEIFPSSGITITFPVTLDGQTNTEEILLENSGLDDLVISNIAIGNPNISGLGTPSPSSFTVTTSDCSGTALNPVAPPAGFCILTITFTPPVGVSGALGASLTFTTNDPANPTLTYGLTGTATSTTQQLTINVTTPGGTVSDSSGAISCSSSGGTCSALFPTGSTVDLFASPNTNFTFAGWGTDACAAFGTSTFCQVTMQTPQTATATFASSGPPPSPQMTINIVGLGNASGMISDGANFNCTITSGVAGANCSATYQSSVGTVTLTATPGSPTFVGWLGQKCSPYNQNTCSIAFTNGTVTLGAVFSGPAQMFQSGQVFLSTDFGMVFVLDSATGNVVQVLSSASSGNTQVQSHGMTFDDVGSLYLAYSQANQLEQFASNGTGPAPFGTGYSTPWSPVIQPSGDLLVGQLAEICDCSFFLPAAVLQFPQGASSTTGASATFFPGFETFSPPVNWIELLDSGDTIAYTNGGQAVRVYDLGEQAQHPDMITGLNGAFALRELPDDTLLVADTSRVIRIDQNGNILKTYTIPSTEATFKNLNLDPDGQTFWTNDESTGILYRVNIQTGAVMNGIGYSTNLVTSVSSGLITQGIGGIAVFGQAQSGGADLAVTMSAPASVQSGANIVYSLSVSNAGPLNATGVTLITTIPNALPVGLSPANCSSATTGSSTVITCPIGSLAANAQPVAATFTMVPTTSGTITATATVSGIQSDPNLANNTATASTVVAAPNLPPTCTLTVAPASGSAPLTVTATGNCIDPNTPPQTLTTSLDFGDGTVLSGVTSGTHTYATAGTFTVKVSATNTSNLTGVVTQIVTVSANLPPTCTLTVAPTAGTAPLAVTATGSCIDPNTQPHALTTSLDFGDGTVVSGVTSGTHTYTKPGSYTVKVSATNTSNVTGFATQVVTVSANLPPTCTLTVAPTTGTAPLAVTATGSCTDPNTQAGALTTSLDFGDGTVVSGVTSGTHTYAKAGSFTVKVSATNSLGITGSATQTVTVGSSVAPTCTLTVTPASGPVPLAITATGNCIGQNAITTTVLNFGDGTSVNASSGTHTYSQTGTFTVTVTATDSFGLTGSATQTVTVNASTFPPGIYVGISGGTVMQFGTDGTVLKTLSTGAGGTVAGMDFDKAGNLYAVDFTAANVTEFNLTSGSAIGSFGSGYNCQPESIVFDGAGNAYVGQQGCSDALLKFDPTGKLLASFQVATEEQGSDDIALSADECTMLYTSEGPSIFRYDVCKGAQLAPFFVGLNKGLTLRILPDGGVLVADLFDIVRINSTGQKIMTYSIPGQQCLYGVALDQDGKTFWADDYCSSNIFHIDLTSGSVLSQFNTGTANGTVFGLAISGTGLNVAGLGNGGPVTASPSSASLAAGQSATFTVSFTPNATAAGKTITLSCAGLPVGLSCSFNPPTITLGAAGTTTTATLTISRTTTAELRHGPSPWVWATSLGVVPAFVLVGFCAPRRRRSSLLWLGLIVASTGIWASCGGGTSMNQSNSTTAQTTPQGAYTVLVVGAGSGVQSSTTVTITVH